MLRSYTALLLTVAFPTLIGAASKTQTFALAETKDLTEQKVKVEAVEYKGRKAVRLTKDTEEEGFAVLKGTDFQDGIEVDFALKITATGFRMPGFIGVAFRARPDASHYELFYVRPGNSQANDQAMRNHSVQYCSAPDFGWYRLRREWPAAYESYAELEPETWTKLKIEVRGRSAKLYLNGSPRPSLVVDGMKGEDLHGAVALWGYAGEESYFSNLRITNESPEAVKNGSEPDGTWNVQGATDSGPLQGSLTLRRAGDKLTGEWSGTLGNQLPVTGTWRDGYVELSFTGEWPKDSGQGAPGSVITTLAGWVDGAAGKGRAKVAGRADGLWMATRRD